MQNERTLSSGNIDILHGHKPYYILIPEWNYPNDRNRGVPFDKTYDYREEALKDALENCEDEIRNFEKYTGCDSTWGEYCPKDEYGREGYIITPRNGLDQWFYFVRVIEVNPMD